ncbi:MAG: ABC-F family ATP-binding cassette domain-containing protein, partial [Alphaproteobacteria bacterium]
MAARVIVSLEDVHLSFGGKPLFEGLTLHVMEGDKICLLGRNGAGKTTLMRLLVEELELDKGSRYAMPGLTTGYLAQKFDFDAQQTVKEFVLAGLPAGKTADLHAYEADMVIEPLGLDAAWMMGNLSGGQLRRAALARALVSEPDILLLDEPTNHLDLNTIEWLEKRLANYRGAVVCVSHDRAFLEAFSSRVFWLSDGIIRICSKGYAAFEAWAEEILEQEARAIQNMEKKFEAEIDWTQGGVTGRRKRNQRRLANLEKLREKLKNDKAVYQQKFRKLSMDPLETVAASKIMAEFRGTSKKFAADDGDKIILDNFELTILRGDRIGILGRNGSGKSTFLKLLLGHEQPDQGTVFRSKTMEPSYFDQNRALLNPRKTLWETLCPQGGDQVSIGSGENSRSRHVCGYLKDFLFDPKIARDQVATLSGGQQNRLMLAKTLANPGNLLILDEPTNDLDMDT